MNLFVTSDNPTIAAQEHCDIHLRKMIVEVAQMLSTAHVELDGVQVAYKPTHKNHPCSKWIRETASNYRWAADHFAALCQEYTHRTAKIHKTASLVNVLSVAPRNIVPGDLQPFAMAMPDEFKILGIYDQTNAYKAYLRSKFQQWSIRTDRRPMVASWTNRETPQWMGQK